MKKEDFYKTNYEKGILTYLPKLKMILTILNGFKGENLLDIGCGDGTFGGIIKKRLKLKKVYGIDIAKQAVSEARRKGILAYCLDVDTQSLPFKKQSINVVYCGELIEHLFDPDHLLEEIYRVLKKEGFLILTTPNLASWYNRLLLLFGFQPFFTDFSLKNSVGHPFAIEPTGHLMVGTIKAIEDLFQIHKFKIIKKEGIGINTGVGWGEKHRFLTRLLNFFFSSPAFSSGILVLAQKE